MKSIRLLPVVIFAALALLAFKGIGLVTNGGYVLTGTSVARAEEKAASGEGGDATMTLPEEPTVTDTSPTLEDKTPTLAGPSDTAHAPPTDAEAPAGEADPHATAPAVPDIGCPEVVPVLAEDAGAAHAPKEEAAAPAHGAAEPAEAVEALPADGCLDQAALLDANGDALPTTRDAAGNIVPLASADGTADTEDVLLGRLSERRTELDQRESDLAMRMALVEAAEKRIDERTAALVALEARINALVDEKKAAEDAQFKSVISMYETMKPKDAAKIFDQLEMSVLLRIAGSLNPRKMAPIMAAMTPSRAQALTAAMATDHGEPTIDLAGENLAQLPQIVGQ